MLDQEKIKALALELDKAEKTRTQMRQFSLQYPEITIEDAYAIQKEWVAHKIAEGRKLVGHKIGLTSRAMQVSLSLTI